MRIEDSVQQKQFLHLEQKSLINILYTANWLKGMVEDFLTPFGITAQQFNILRILRGQKGASIYLQEIKARMLERNPDVSRLIERLVAAGWVIRDQDPENRRKVEVRISASGLMLLESIDEHIDALFAPFRKLSQSQLELLNQILDQIREAEN
jgi:DNA-binding MarR family transcriptional regulator